MKCTLFLWLIVDIHVLFIHLCTQVFRDDFREEITAVSMCLLVMSTVPSMCTDVHTISALYSMSTIPGHMYVLYEKYVHLCTFAVCMYVCTLIHAHT